MRSYRYTFQGALEISERLRSGYYLTQQYFWYTKKEANKQFTQAKRKAQQ